MKLLLSKIGKQLLSCLHMSLLILWIFFKLWMRFLKEDLEWFDDVQSKTGSEYSAGGK